MNKKTFEIFQDALAAATIFILVVFTFTYLMSIGLTK